MKCPSCSAKIDSENINVQTDIGKCENCGNIFRISESISNNFYDKFDIKNPPKGAWFRQEMNSIAIGATTRSPIAFFLVPFMLVWSGFSIGGIYGTQIMKGEFDLFSSLFGIPFLIGSVIFWTIALMAIVGKVEIKLDNYGGKIFTGIGSIGKTKKFLWEDISNIAEGNSMSYNFSNKTNRSIIIEGSRRLTFGLMLNSSRSYYLRKALQQIYIKKQRSNYIV